MVGNSTSYGEAELNKTLVNQIESSKDYYVTLTYKLKMMTQVHNEIFINSFHVI